MYINESIQFSECLPMIISSLRQFVVCDSYMDRNSLTVIADGAFRGLRNVTYLYVSQSVLSDLVNVLLGRFSLQSSVGQKMSIGQSAVGDALRLVSKGRLTHSICG